MYVCTCVYAESDDNMEKPVLSFNHVGYGD